MAKAQNEVLDLPDSVDAKLRNRLQAGISNLGKRVPATCDQQQTQTQETAPPTTTHGDDDHRDDDDRHRRPPAPTTDTTGTGTDTTGTDTGDDGHRHGRRRARARPAPTTGIGGGDGAMMAGQVLADRYELGERLGVGGMSTVVRAFDDRLERDVAVKLLAEHLADDDQFVARFRREALAVARLVHPNIVQVFDFGLDEPTAPPVHRHGVRPRAVGRRDPARARASSSVRDALSIVAQACRGLEYAHRNGVVHRDVKPGNLLRGEDGVVKLADFGIAKAFSDESSITQVGSVLGTAAYLAPEQAAGEQAGPAADLYALGVVTYQLLSGRLPYEAQSLTELALKQQREVPPRLDELNPDVSPQLAMAVDRALALDPRQRPPSADDLRSQLADGARGIGPAYADPTTSRAAGPADERHQRRRAAAHGRHRRRARPGPAAPAPAAAHPAPGADLRHAGAGRRTPAPARRAPSASSAACSCWLLLAAGGAAAVVATSNSDQAVELRRVVYDDVQQGVDAVKEPRQRQHEVGRGAILPRALRGTAQRLLHHRGKSVSCGRGAAVVPGASALVGGTSVGLSHIPTNPTRVAGWRAAARTGSDRARSRRTSSPPR